MTQVRPLRLIGGDDERHGDTEVVVIEHDPGDVAPFVDPPERRLSLLDRIQGDRTPIVAPWLLNAKARKEAFTQFLFHCLYWSLLHLIRIPTVYTYRVVIWSPRGSWRAANATLRWVFGDDDGGYHLRQAAARLNNGDLYLELKKQARKDSAFRLPAFGVIAVAALVTGSLLYFFAPWWAQAPAIVAVLTFLAWIGRPENKTLTDRVMTGRRFTRITAEMVRNALIALSIKGITDPGQLKFPQEIHRDGPGWLARVDLPPGIEAVKVIEARGKLSSAMRLPVDQIWPFPGPEHEGQLDLWVGYKPASKMDQARWELASPTARTNYFEAFHFANDPRAKPVHGNLFERNWLIGGMPGSGKSYAAKALAKGALLDPIVEVKIAEFKGSADFGDLAEFCSSYVCGIDDLALEEGADIVFWALAEAERRAKRIRKARERGEAPHGKATPELAARKGSGLHPIVIIIDEAHELLANDEAAKAVERAIRRTRAFAMTWILATQVADADSVPTIITKCVNMRWCLAVMEWQANDQILGTGAYKRGETAIGFRPEIDAGWGYLKGLREPISARSQFPDEATDKAIIDRIRQLRGGMVVGGAHESHKRNIVEDLRACFRPGEPGLHWEIFAERLPDVDDSYEATTAEIVSAQARAKGVPSKNVKVAGTVLKGAYLKDLQALLEGSSGE